MSDDASFQGDCEDLMLTVLEVLIATGIPQSRLYKIVTRTGKQQINENHMIGGYQLSDGKIWVIGDTFKQNCRELDEVESIHVVSRYSRMDWGSFYNEI